jgi:hypothetical protein
VSVHEIDALIMDETPELPSNHEVVSEVAEPLPERTDKHRGRWKKLSERTYAREHRNDVAFRNRAPADELDQLMLGTATIKASDQVKNTRMIHPEGFGVRRSWMESRAPGPNGIGRPSR